MQPRQECSHFSQNVPVKPSTHWHCCQDQWSKQVPPCLQGLAVQAPSSLGHLRTHKPTIRQSDGGVGGGEEGRGKQREEEGGDEPQFLSSFQKKKKKERKLAC